MKTTSIHGRPGKAPFYSCRLSAVNFLRCLTMVFMFVCAVLDLRRHGRIYFAQAFAGAMKKAYPDLPGADGLEELAKALYK